MGATITRIATFQRELRELGRIRMGQQVASGRGGKRPEKLKTFRLTSASREYIEAAAAAYRGEVREWESPRGREYEIIIESPTLDVLVPPGNALSQAFELWTAAGCQRRCDGIRQQTGEACACPEEVEERTALAAKGEACKPTTRLWVILPRLPDFGRWRLEAHGYYAAVELAGMAEIASMATSQGVMLNARLRIDQRRRKIPGQPTREYIVPVLELPDTNFGQLVSGGFIPTTATAAIGVGEVPKAALPPGDTALAKPKRRAERVDRPALGPAPTLPERTEFTRPRGETPAPTVEPPRVAGWTVEEPATAPAAGPAPVTEVEVTPEPTAPSATAPGPSTAAKPAIGPMTTAELSAWLKANRIAGDYAGQVARELWPDTKTAADLTDEQRGALARELAGPDGGAS